MELDRQIAIERHMDPFGKVWGAATIKGYSLYQIGNPDEDGGINIPRKINNTMSGRFTSLGRAEVAIQMYLNQQWDKIDEKKTPSERVENATETSR